jgi:hypothetical protein
MNEFNEKYDEQIEKHIKLNSYRDRRIAGVLIGMGVFGGMGFLIFSGTAVFGISGGKY